MKKFKILAIAIVAIIGSIAIGTVMSASNTIEETPITGNIEYNIPNITSGTMNLAHAQKIFTMMPYDVKEQSVLAFRDITSKNSKSFDYNGVRITHPSDSTWTFTYNGAKITVNASIGALTTFFQMPPVI